MPSPLSFSDSYIASLLKKEADPINQARIKMLVYIILAYTGFAAILIVVYYMQGQFLQFLRVCIVIFNCAVCLVILKYFNVWKVISHILVIMLTLTVWSNLSIYVRNINVATLQYVWFACALGFFMLGLKWGWFYSVLNVLPLLLYTAMDGEYYFLGSGPQKLEKFTYLFVISYDFAVIIFLHYFFFKTFQKNFVKLSEARNELRDVNDKLSDAVHDLKKLSADRMNFLSTMSHELRTPMNGVIGISNALIHQGPREDQKENMDLLKFSAENLLHLINDILDFNKLDAQKVELETVAFDLVTLIKNNFAGLEFKAAEKELEFVYTIDARLHGKNIISDPTRLTQILLNLLNNAIKFTKKGRVSLHTTVIAETGNLITVRFTVEDTGMGIAPERQKDIFEPFVQASTSVNRNYGGTGLGLPIVKKLLEMFNSTILLKSELNAGTSISFDVRFGYETAEMCVTPTAPDNKANIDHLRVLVAEDNRINSIVITKTLERWNIKPTIVENGVEVLNLLKTQYFDIILMDLHMPEMDGYETTTAIRNLPDEMQALVPIIAFTATTEHGLMQKITGAGMNDLLSKPFKPEDLLTKLKTLTGSNKKAS